jgi:hypothetical protein
MPLARHADVSGSVGGERDAGLRRGAARLSSGAEVAGVGLVIAGVAMHRDRHEGG